MKILIFYQYFGTPSGSWSTRMYELTRRWVKEGNNVTVITAPYEKSDIKATGFISRTNIEGVNLIIINSGDSNRSHFFKRALNALIFSVTACKMALTEPCDIVIASSGPITVGIPALLAKWVRRKTMVFEIRDLWPQGAIELGKLNNNIARRFALWFEKICYQNSSLVVACSPGMESSVNKRFPEINTLVISNAADPDLFLNKKSGKSASTHPLHGKKYFLYAGSLGLMDHGALMIKAMEAMNDPSIHLIIIGDGAEKIILETMASKAELKNIQFLGLKPKSEIVTWLQYAEGSLVLFKDYPVLQTSSPNKLFDAFAAGVPVIHNTTGWIKDLVDSSNCGISILPEDFVGLAKAMQYIAYNPNYRQSASSNSAKLGQTVFNRDLLSTKYLSNLNKFISK